MLFLFSFILVLFYLVLFLFDVLFGGVVWHILAGVEGGCIFVFLFCLSAHTCFSLYLFKTCFCSFLFGWFHCLFSFLFPFCFSILLLLSPFLPLLKLKKHNRDGL